MECKDERRIFKNTCSGKCKDQARKFFFPMKEVTDDEHVHNDSSSKELSELVQNIIKSDSMTTTTTTIDKLFADGGASMKAMRFLGICER